MLEPDDLLRARNIVLQALDDALAVDGILDSKLLQRLRPARPNLDRVPADLTSGDRHGPAYRIANPAMTLANDVFFLTDPPRAATLLRLAVRLYESVNGYGNYTKSLETCRAQLAALGSVGQAADPVSAVTPSTTVTGGPAAAGEVAPVTVVPSIPSQIGDTVALRPPDVVAPDTATVLSTATVTNSTTVSYPVDSSANDRFTSASPSWSRLLEDWRMEGGDRDVEESIARFREHMVSRLERAPGAAELLLPDLEEDFAVLRGEFAGLMYHEAAPEAIRLRAVNARRCCLAEQASAAGRVSATETAGVRTRWLASGVWNYALQQVWNTNEHQVLADVLGYLSAIQIQNRYKNERREILLAATELIPLLCLDLRDTELKQVQFVHQWVRHSVGTHLLICGPEPTTPKQSRFDPRVQDPHDETRNLNRDSWAIHLLTRWTTEREEGKRTSVALALLILSGWNANRVDRMLSILFDTPYSDGVGAERTKEIWQAEVAAMLATIRTVHIANNPWMAGSSASNSLSTSERDASVRLPDRVLKVVTGELAQDQTSIVLTGALFRDGRVPTFLCHNDLGAYGVLKIDETSRVRREKQNFDKYAKRLHASYRASECAVGTSVIANSSSGEGYQGILTSYVFRRSDVPKTLTGWLSERHVDDPGPVLKELFEDALRPWLSHARRCVGDLRTEYPVLRPSSFERTSFGPDRHAETELANFRLPEVADAFGVPGGLEWRHHTLGPLLEGSALGCSPLAQGFNYTKATNPLWLAAQVAEVSARDEETAKLVDKLLYGHEHALTTTSYLNCISHGDLHGDNVLISGADPTQPQLHVIDFETTHTGHICKDFARLESALWSRVFTWDSEQLSLLRPWFVKALSGPDLWDPVVPEDIDSEVRTTLLAVRKLRTTLKKCEQPLWPMHDSEYQWALFASLLPFARYPDSDAPDNRFLPFLFASDIAEVLTRWAASA